MGSGRDLESKISCNDGLSIPASSTVYPYV